MKQERIGGVLLPVTSLPGDYGIGTFGRDAYEFLNRLHRMGMAAWQVLPLTPAAKGDSPYSSYSAFAGESILIDPEQLLAMGLITAAELADVKDPTPGYAVDYEVVRLNRRALFHTAFGRVGAVLQARIDAWKSEQPWLRDWALYIVLHEHYDGAPWWEWPDEGLRLHQEAALQQAEVTFADRIAYEVFLQYLFFTQWMALKAEANLLGIGLIGDMPIYVCQDSADAWSRPELFELDEEHMPRAVAGVPPDYFAEDGQLWGNPLYDWKAMAEDDYSWWVARMGHALSMFDAVRIDHFRGLCAYWSVPADAKTAKEGHWVKGPGMALFNAIFAQYPEGRIIAEDLGDIDAPVHALRREAGLPGMGVLQFAFQGDEYSPHLPFNMTPDTVAYTGTHDNNTTLGWLWEITPEHRADALDYAGFAIQGDNWQQGGVDAPAVRALLRTVWLSPAATAIAPIQDLLGYGGDCRVNIPGLAEGNWRFRVTRDALDSLDEGWVRRLNETARRCHPFAPAEE